MTEITIDLKDLFYHILKKWKLLVLCALIGAVLLDAYGYKKASASASAELARHARYEEARADLPEGYTEERYEIRSALTDTEAEFVEAYANVYNAYIAECAYGDPAESGNLAAYMQFMSSFKDVKSVMNSSEWAYFNLLTEAETDVAEEQPSSGEAQEASLLQLKWLVIGAILGAAAAACAAALPYLLSRRVRTGKDMECAYGIPTLATVRNTGDAEIAMLTAGIGALLAKKQCDAVFFTGGKGKQTEALQQKLMGQFSREEIGSAFCTPDDFTAESIAQLEHSAVVLIVELRKDSYADAERELAFCRLYGKQILGCIIIE